MDNDLYKTEAFHYDCIKIIDAIIHFNGNLQVKKTIIERYDVGSEEHNKTLHDIEIHEKCIKRFKNRYEKIMFANNFKP